MNLYDALPDKSIVQRVNEIFYDKVYEHEWLSLFFKHVDIEHIRRQQTNFIVGAIGGPKLYVGRLAQRAHVHMFITEELFELRQSLLTQAMDEAHAPAELKEKWLRIDFGFKHGMVKKSIGQCTKRFWTDEIVSFENPARSRGRHPGARTGSSESARSPRRTA